MIGMGLALVVGFFAWIFCDTNISAFLITMNALYVWYWAWAIILGMIIAIPSLVAALGGAVIGSESTDSKIGGLVGSAMAFILGGSVTGILLLKFIVKRVVLVIGAFLLKTSGTSQVLEFSEFNGTKLILGTIILCFGVFAIRGGFFAALRSREPTIKHV